MEMTTDDSMSLSDDSRWLSSDHSDIEELLQDNNVEMVQILLEVQEFEDRVKLMDQRRGSNMGRVTIYRHHALRNEHLMQDYFAKVPTYPPRLFRRRLVSGVAPTCNYKIMDNEYSMGYYLTDGIYPEWATLVKSIKEKNGVPLTRKEAHFTKAQEAARKDIERAFGVLQARRAAANPISGIQRIASGTLPERGIITGGLYITMPASGLMRE
ncbi:hypothetical protein QYE76_020575 [Lolium multiflorum]|uniref:Uncharacterized protein n=1 Tax=Lolium multiflorum TaxID=4521 RepID=A0AAD8R944_LOLMU|nr:hypothetical protein QYE76_020575 [Lolium multiflorum]